MKIKGRWRAAFSIGLMGWWLWGAPLYADDLEDAQAAFAAGDYQEALLLLRPLLLEGDPTAEYLYGRMLEQGAGVPRDLDQAVAHYRRAAAAGNLQARQRLEVLSIREGDAAMAEGDSVAVDWFREAAESGDPNAQFNYAHALEIGWGTRRDEAEARRWFLRAAEADHDGAQLRLGLMMAVGAGGPRAEAEGVRWIRRAARNGNPLAEALVQDLLDGEGPVDDRLAELLARLRPVVWEGEEAALERLEMLLLAREGAGNTPPAGIEERPSTETAVAGGGTAPAPAAPSVTLPDTVFRLVVSDPGHLRDVIAAYRRAAQAGVMEAQFALAVLHLQGRGVPRDQERGLEWMRRAAEQGYFPAQSYLRLVDGDFGSVPLRGSIVLDWAKERALQWDPQAFYLLGRVFETGRGVVPDPTEARRWFQMAELVGGGSVRGASEAAPAGGGASGGVAKGISLRDGWMLATILFVAGVLLLAWWLYRRRTTRLQRPPGETGTESAGRGRTLARRRPPAVVDDEDLNFARELWRRPERGEVIDVASAAPPPREQPAPGAPPSPPVMPDPKLAARRPARPSPPPSLRQEVAEEDGASSAKPQAAPSPPPPPASEPSGGHRRQEDNVIRLPSDALIPLSTADIEAQKIARERRMRRRVDADTLLQELRPPQKPHSDEGRRSDPSGEREPEAGEAADRRDLAEVQFNIGLMFANGDGVPRNPALAAKWFEKAANQGHADAQFRLGGLYLTGELGEKDLLQAKVWLQRAAESGHPRARELLDKIHDRRNSGGAA